MKKRNFLINHLIQFKFIYIKIKLSILIIIMNTFKFFRLWKLIKDQQESSIF